MSSMSHAGAPTNIDPIARVHGWWDEARAAEPTDLSSSMVLSTVDERGRPSSRVVLLRSLDARGFVFYTNLRSEKGRDVERVPYAALCFHWPRTAEGTLGRQVRVEGAVERVSDAEADAYFASRPRESQLGAWASDQSEPLSDRAELLARLEHQRKRWEGRDVARPPHWSGLRVVPDVIELWREGSARLHIRERFERVAAAALSEAGTTPQSARPAQSEAGTPPQSARPAQSEAGTTPMGSADPAGAGGGWRLTLLFP